MASSRNSSVTRSSRSQTQPEVTLDDVAAVVAGLNGKVMQLRREILALRGTPEWKKTDRRAGCHDSEDDDDDDEIMDESQFCGKNNGGYIVRRKNPSRDFLKRASQLREFRECLCEHEDRSSTPFSSDEKIPKRKNSRRESRNYSRDFSRKSRNSSIPSIERDDYYTGRMKERRNASVTSDRINRSLKKEISTQTEIIIDPKETRRNSSVFFQQNFNRNASNNEETDFHRNRRNSHRNQNGGSRLHEMPAIPPDSQNGGEKPRQSMEDNEKNRNLLLLNKDSIECRGIRNALGLSTDYCDCSSTGSAVRRVRRKRISRGVQCDLSNDKKEKKPQGCFGSCFSKSKKKNFEKYEEKSKTLEASKKDDFKNEKYEEHRRRSKNDSEKNNIEMKIIPEERIAGGGERKWRESKNRKIYSLGCPQNFDNSQRHHGRTRPKEEPLNDTWNEKNEVMVVKRRLNECLVELNGIIGDVGHIFKENNTNR